MGRRESGGAGMTLKFIIDAILTVVGISTPILLAGAGELVVEKSGVLNLGVEGMMLCGAIAGFAVTFVCTDPSYADALPWLAAAGPWLGAAAAAAAGALAALLFGFMALTLGANQVASGLALVIFGTGISSLIGTSFTGIAIQPFDQLFPDALAQDPLARVVFGYSPLVYFALLMVGAVWWFLNRTRAGLVLRAVGENDLSAHSIGYSVIGVRYLAVLFGGAMAGIAGAYFSMVTTPLWAERMTAGKGWIALALVVFSGWRAGRLLGGAYFFGLFMTLELYAKASGFSFLPSQFWASMPYLMAVLVLAVMSARARGGSEAPACLGKPFIPDA
jgi:general nucleoside transport system permease protein